MAVSHLVSLSDPVSLCQCMSSCHLMPLSHFVDPITGSLSIVRTRDVIRPLGVIG